MIEQIVRPFTAAPVIATRRIVGAQIQIPSETAIVSWGEAGDLPEAQADDAPEDPQTGFTILECKDKLNEKSRKVTPTRVENPDDSSQYVMVDNINTITFDKKDNKASNVPWELADSTTAFSDFSIPASGVWGTIKPGDCSQEFRLKPST